MTIDFVYNIDFKLDSENAIKSWIKAFCQHEGFTVDSLVFAFFSDEEVKRLNIKYLSHNYYTDVISFDDSNETNLKGNIAISIDRVRENSKNLNLQFDEELRRVMIHGVLHFMGHKDKTKEQILNIRSKEDHALSMFHVKQ